MTIVITGLSCVRVQTVVCSEAGELTLRYEEPSRSARRAAAAGPAAARRNAHLPHLATDVRLLSVRPAPAALAPRPRARTHTPDLVNETPILLLSLCVTLERILRVFTSHWAKCVHIYMCIMFIIDI